MMELRWKHGAENPSKENTSSFISFSFIPQLKSIVSEDFQIPQVYTNEDSISFKWVSSSSSKIAVSDSNTVIQKNSRPSLITVLKKLVYEEAHPCRHPQPLALLNSSVEALSRKNKRFKEKSQLQNGGALFCCIGLSGRQIDKLNLSQTDAGFIPQNQIDEKTIIEAEFLNNGDELKRSISAGKEKIQKGSVHESAFVTLKHLSAGALSAIVSRCSFSS
jgi:hypothetical protein